MTPLSPVRATEPVPSFSARQLATVDLLWTGGWDSTYRLLDLVLRKSRTVAPHYVVDPDRSGTIQELRAMRAIRQEAAKSDRAAADRILPTRITLVDSIAADAATSEKFTRLRNRSYLGIQYEWLARLTKQQAIDGLELCIHADDRAEAFVRDYVEHVADADGETYWRVRPEHLHEDIGLFGSFRFPLLNLTKCEMREAAAAAGFQRLMALTWFCHSPIQGRACGVCAPCCYTINEGLADRLSGRALLRNRFSSQYRAMLRMSSAFHKSVARLAKPLVRQERKRRGVEN
jgi:hypothetical protein